MPKVGSPLKANRLAILLEIVAAWVEGSENLGVAGSSLDVHMGPSGGDGSD